MVDPVYAAPAQSPAPNLPTKSDAPTMGKSVAAGNAYSSGGSLPTVRGEPLQATQDAPTVSSNVTKSRQVEVFGRNEGFDGLLSGTGPITREMWKDPKQVLGQLTQSSKANPENLHCVGCALLAGAIIRGPEVTARYLEKIASYGKGFLTDQHVDRLKAIAAKIRSGRATFEDLGDAQDITFRAIDREMFDYPDSLEIDIAGKQLTVSDLADISSKRSNDMGKAVTAAIRQFGSKNIIVLNYKTEYTGDFLDSFEVSKAASAIRLNLVEMTFDRSRTDAAHYIMDQLGKGECATVAICYTMSDGSLAGHCILFGKYPDGSPYIYNSDPVDGQATFVVGKPTKPNVEFNTELAKYDEGVQRAMENDDWLPTKMSYQSL